MKKVITLITIIGFAISVGSTMSVPPLTGNDWDDVPDILLPVPVRP